MGQITNLPLLPHISDARNHDQHAKQRGLDCGPEYRRQRLISSDSVPCQIFSITRIWALRLRGFSASSAAPGFTAFRSTHFNSGFRGGAIREHPLARHIRNLPPMFRPNSFTTLFSAHEMLLLPTVRPVLTAFTAPSSPRPTTRARHSLPSRNAWNTFVAGDPFSWRGTNRLDQTRQLSRARKGLLSPVRARLPARIAAIAALRRPVPKKSSPLVRAQPAYQFRRRQALPRVNPTSSGPSCWN